MFLLVFGLREQDRVDGTQTFIVNMYSKSKVRKYEEWLANLRCLFPTPRLLGRDGTGGSRTITIADMVTLLKLYQTVLPLLLTFSPLSEGR